MRMKCKKISLDQILISLIYIFPFITIIRFNLFVLQVETIVFILILINIATYYMMGNLFIDISSKYKKYQILFVIIIFFSNIISLMYISDVTLPQIKDLSFWLLSMSPLLLFSKKENSFSGIINSIMISSLISVSLVLLLRTGIRGSGFISNANLAGALFSMSALLIIANYFEYKNRIYLLSFIMSVIGVIATGSRESLIGLILALIIFALLNYKGGLFSLIKLSIYLILLFSLVNMLLNRFFPEVLNRYIVTIEKIMTLNYDSIDFAFANRLTIYTELTNWIIDNPYYPLGFRGLQTLPIYGQYAHNMFLQSYVVGSIFGFIGFLSFLISLFVENIKLLKKYNDYYIKSILAIYISYVISGVVSDHFMNFFTWNFVFFTVLRTYKQSKKS